MARCIIKFALFSMVLSTFVSGCSKDSKEAVNSVTVTAVLPSSGSAGGGATVSITGTGFLSDATVQIGSKACSSIARISSSEISCTIPESPAATVSIEVRNPDGVVGRLSSAFSYTRALRTIGLGDLNFPQGIMLHSDGYLYVADYSNHRIVRYNVETNAISGWIGRINSTVGLGGATGCSTAASGDATPGWCTGGTSQTGTGDGMFNFPSATAVDANGYLYVVSIGDGRVLRYVLSTGVFTGWIGKIGTTAGLGGAAGCATANVGDFTPGWCTGGTATTGTTSDGAISGSEAIQVDGSYLYLSDGPAHRINRYTVSSGAYGGWIGRINSIVGLGGAAGCAAAASGDFTPGWCTGGTSQSGGDNGMLFRNKVFQIVDGVMYVADSRNHRISRYTASTGAFTGWIGRINSIVGLGGAAGCATAASGDYTPGWCTGGTSQTGTGDGALNRPYGVSIDSAGYLYVADQLQHRISKYVASTGAFVGWMGRVNSIVGLGGETGCSTTASGSATPGWCTGGTSQSGSGLGIFTSPPHMLVDSARTYLYIIDSTAGSIQRLTPP